MFSDMTKVILTAVLLSLALAACDDSAAPINHADVSRAEFALDSIEGVAYGRYPFERVGGTLSLNQGEWVQNWRFTADGTHRELADQGTYSVSQGPPLAIYFRSRVSQMTDTGTVNGGVLAVRRGSFVFHWLRER